MRHPEVEIKFNSYPENVRNKLSNLREMIIESADEIDTINEIEETLKWGEPSYMVNKGSTIRIDWKEKSPGQYAMYFKCTSKLVPTFKEVYGNLFRYEKNRAIVFQLDGHIPEEELKSCIKAALKYHLVKNKHQLDM